MSKLLINSLLRFYLLRADEDIWDKVWLTATKSGSNVSNFGDLHRMMHGYFFNEQEFKQAVSLFC